MTDNWYYVRGKVVDFEEEDMMRVEPEGSEGETVLRWIGNDFNVVKAKDPEMVGIGDIIEFYTCDREQKFYHGAD